MAAAVDAIGGLLGVAEFPTTSAGHGQLLSWLNRLGPVARVGIEGTSLYGTGLARHLRASGVEVVEVDRPNRQSRRRTGKSDPADAIEAARAAHWGRPGSGQDQRRQRGRNKSPCRGQAVGPLSQVSRPQPGPQPRRHATDLREQLKGASRQDLAAMAGAPASPEHRPGGLCHPDGPCTARPAGARPRRRETRTGRDARAPGGKDSPRAARPPRRGRRHRRHLARHRR